jgi:hypothetical protein
MVTKKIDKSTKITTKNEKQVLYEVKAALDNGNIRPSSQVMSSFASGKFTQNDLEYLVKYGKRNLKYDYLKGGRLVYGISVTDRDNRSYYAQFDLINLTLVLMEKIEVT